MALKTFLGWCDTRDVEPTTVSCGQLEMYVQRLEGRGSAPATLARRIGTVATFDKYAVIHGLSPINPAAHQPARGSPGNGQDKACRTTHERADDGHRHRLWVGQISFELIIS